MIAHIINRERHHAHDYQALDRRCRITGGNTALFRHRNKQQAASYENALCSVV
jgi:hypothetical protein